MARGQPAHSGPAQSWLLAASSVFDGARVFEGVMPDIELHAQRVRRSAQTIGLNPPVDAETIIGLAREGVKKFAPGTPLYVKPMIWARATRARPSCRIRMIPASSSACSPRRCRNPRAARSPVALSPADAGMHADRCQGRVPLSQQCPALREAKARGFDNALVRISWAISRN